MKTKSKIVLERRHIINNEFQTLTESFDAKKLAKPTLKLLCGTLDVLDQSPV